MKLRVEQGNIYDCDSKKKYNLKDKTDMEILCHDINETLLFKEFELKDKENIINRISEFLSEVKEK